MENFRLSKDSFYSSFFSSKRFGFGRSTAKTVAGGKKGGKGSPKAT
jgi:hypothetical protein